MSESTAIVSWADKLAGFAKEAAKEEKATGTMVTCRSGQLMIAGQPVAGNKLSVVIIGSIYENAYYSDDYDSDNPKSPTCFAFAKTEEALVPHEDSAKAEHDKCKGCQYNEFGSADKGKGKACKNIRRLAMISASPLNAETVQSGEVALMKLPVTSVKEWTKYVQTLNLAHKRPAFAVITELGAVPDPKTQFKITFTFKGLIEDDLVGALVERHQTVYDLMAIPYAQNTEAPAEPKKVVSKKGKF
jgi:hypothetical protein